MHSLTDPPPTPPHPPPPPQTIAVPQTLTISSDGYQLNVSSTTSANLAPSYLFPATSGFSGQITAWADPIISVRISGVIQCYAMQIIDGNLGFVSLGGAGVDGYAAQCNPAAYSAIANVYTAPSCSSQPGSRAPYTSSLLFQSTSSKTSSGAASSALALAAALGTIAAVVLAVA